MTHAFMRLDDGRHMTVPLTAFTNGGTDAPVAGDLLIYRSTPGQRVGHVAVVLSVSINPGGVSYIRVGEQNQENDIMFFLTAPGALSLGCAVKIKSSFSNLLDTYV